MQPAIRSDSVVSPSRVLTFRPEAKAQRFDLNTHGLGEPVNSFYPELARGHFQRLGSKQLRELNE